MWTRELLKTNAKEKLRVYYWSGLVAVLIYSFIGGAGGRLTYSFTGSLSTLQEQKDPAFEYTYQVAVTFLILLIVLLIVLAALAVLAMVFLVNPLLVGLKRFFLQSGERKTDVQEMFFAFRRGHYLNVVKVMFLRNLYLFLWSLLFVVPGIIKSYEYSMIPYLLAEDPTLDSRQVFRLTWEMTEGEKWNIFVLELSFFGWLFLGVMACGIGVLFVEPYMEATYVELFLALKAKLYYSQKPYRQPLEQGNGWDNWG